MHEEELAVAPLHLGEAAVNISACLFAQAASSILKLKAERIADPS